MSYGFFKLSMSQALGVWSDLCDAYHGKGWGGDTAEIYMYRFMSDSPTVNISREPGKPLSGMAAEAHGQRVADANEALWALLAHFAEERDCRLEVEGRPFGVWVATSNFDHRVHVRVVPQ